LFVEIRVASFHAARASEVVSGDLTRTPAGRLTGESRSQFLAALRPLLPPGGRGTAIPCHCAIPGTGVLLHEVRLPAASPEETARLLRLRVESEFPLAPEALAWGSAAGQPAADGSRDFRLAAVRKEVLAEYLELFRQLELSPVISLAALARTAVLPKPVAAGVLLDVGPRDAELVILEGGRVVSVRGLAQGGSKREGFDWSGALHRQGLAGRLMVTGIPVRTLEDPAAVSPGSPGWEELAAAPVGGVTMAINGLRRLVANPGPPGILALNEAPVLASPVATAAWPWPWIGLGAALLLALALVPSLEAVLRGPGLARRVAALKAEAKTLSIIDREFEFLRHLETSQPPYLEAMYLVASSAPPGLRLESTSMNRRGEVALRGKTQNMAQIGELRTKLMASGFFSSVVVEDQTQGQDRQAVQFRLNARWKSPEDRDALTLGPTLPSPTNAALVKTNSTAPSR